jgi:hypothetical protein
MVSAAAARSRGEAPCREIEHYTGSIVIVPDRGDFCWQRIIDNRTGKM